MRCFLIFEHLLHHHNEVIGLDEPFNHNEIDDIIKELHSNKSPGPNGFNGVFSRKFWNIIKSMYMIYVINFMQDP
jgi:hypothetical protein